MTPFDLRELLAVLTAAGVHRAKFEPRARFEPGLMGIDITEIEFKERPEPLSAFVTAEGEPVDLNEGLPPLAQDDWDPQAIERANRKANQ